MKFLVACALLFLLVACSPVQTEEPVRIGVSESLSGVAAYYGESTRKGIELAHEEIRALYPDFALEVYHEDNLFTPKGGVSAYTKLRADHDIDAVITQTSPATISVQSLAAEEGVVQMAVSASVAEYSTPNDLSFRITPGTAIEGEVIVDFIASNGYGSMGILYMDNEIGASIKDAVIESAEERQVSVLSEESFLIDATDFRTSLLKLQEADPGILFAAGTAGHVGRILQQLEEIDFDVQIIGFRATEDPSLMEVAGDLAEGVLYTYAFNPYSEEPTVENFVSSYEQKYGVLPDGYAAESYEGFKVLAMAYSECGKNNACVKNYLMNLENHDTVFGDLTFDVNGDVHYDFFVKTVENGQFVPYRS